MRFLHLFLFSMLAPITLLLVAFLALLDWIHAVLSLATIGVLVLGIWATRPKVKVARGSTEADEIIDARAAKLRKNEGKRHLRLV